ncbi:hypothetical protein GONAM_09_00920 [Gordonia namibiensis NBRC 108229]|uniref:Uncharacterized protein n=1 Tax=Gordonia namibiensis NBRC 108229 TaxID=1208314 RepID=K6X077_9ACTN|nr:hypothetical protein GONAM_09_00920 [Gordonia namibiensis NBRC 108229]
MLPTRQQLTGWAPAALAGGGESVDTAGATTESAVGSVYTACQSLPSLRGWTGLSHDAGTAAFRRATNSATDLASFAASVGLALSEGAHTLGKARTDLLAKADAVDASKLWVTDAWVVLIDPIEMSIEEADRLAGEANRQQGAINQLLLAVDAADNSVAQAIQAAAGKHGWTNPSTNMFVPIPGLVAPTDQVPNPGTLLGLQQQLMVRAEDMAMTVRATEKFEDDQGRHKILYMQDGSRQVITEWDPYRGSMPSMKLFETTVKHYDRGGKVISTSHSWEDLTGTKVFSTTWADGTTAYAEEWEDGYKTGRVTTPDGRTGDIPADSPFFSHPIETTIGGVLSGVDKYVDDGHGIPRISAAGAEKLGAGAKYGGPALAIGVGIYDVVVAEDKCVAGFSAAFGAAGGYAGGVLGAGASAPGGPAAVAGAAGGSMAGSWLFGWVGKKVGEAVCPAPTS